MADTPLCKTDRSILLGLFPDIDASIAATIVDLGCGSGRTALELSSRGYRVVGVDLSQSMLEVVRRKSRADGQSVAVVRANLVELECFAADSFDHAVCLFSTLGMIQGHECRRRMLSHVEKIVVPRGRFVFHVHHRWAALGEPGGFKRLSRSWWDSIRSKEHQFGDSTYAYRGIEDMFMHRFSLRELQADLAATGWSIEHVHCLSADSAHVIPLPRLLRHRVGGFLVSARNRRESPLPLAGEVGLSGPGAGLLKS